MTLQSGQKFSTLTKSSLHRIIGEKKKKKFYENLGDLFHINYPLRSLNPTEGIPSGILIGVNCTGFTTMAKQAILLKL